MKNYNRSLMYGKQLGDESGRNSIMGILRRRWLVVAGCFIAVPAIALAIALGQQRQYTASASLLFRTLALNPGSGQSTPLPPSPDPAREANTNLTLAALRPVATRTAATVADGLTPDQVERKVRIESEGQSDVARVSATDPNASRAAKIANTYATQYIAFRRASDQATLRQPIHQLTARISRLSKAERGSALGQSLKQRLDYLRSLADVQTGNVERVQEASVPTSPSSPRPVRNAAIGAVLGLLLGVALACLLDLADRRLKDTSEIEGML